MCSARRKRGASTAAAAAALCALCLLRAAYAVHGQATAAAAAMAEPPDPAPTTPRSSTAAATAQMPADDGPTTHHPPHAAAAAAAAGKNDDADVLRQVLAKRCLHRYTMTCVKLDLIRLVDRLGAARAYQLVPGVSLVRAADGAVDNRTEAVAETGDDRDHQQQDHPQQQHFNHGNGIPPDVARSLIRGNDSSAEELDGYLMEKVDAYLSSLSISVKLVDSSVVENVRKISSQMLVHILPTDLLETGRGKKDSMRTALWSAGALAAVGFASLAAMSGKALMTAMLALALAAMCALKGHGGGGGGGGGLSGGYGKTSHYEIITKPAIYEHDHLVHGAAYSSAPYSYARHLSTDEAGGGGLQNGVGLAGGVNVGSSGGGGGGGGVGGAFHVGGRGVPASPPQHVSIVHAAPASQDRDPGQQHNAAAEDGEDDGTVLGQASYPLAPIAYIPTTNNA